MYLDLAGVEFAEEAERAGARAFAHVPRANVRATAQAETPVNDRREIFGWIMYDWANSAFYTTVVTTLTSPYITALAQSAPAPSAAARIATATTFSRGPAAVSSFRRPSPIEAITSLPADVRTARRGRPRR